MYGSSNAHAAQALTTAMRRHKAAERATAQGPIAVGPGGRIVDATPYLRNMHKAELHVSVYGAIDKDPDKYLKNHRPGWRYLWVDVKDQMALGRIRSGRYVEILVDDLQDDTDLPFIDGPMVKRLKPTHKGTSGAVYLYDLQLVACSPETWKSLFGIREDIGMGRISQGIDYLREQAAGLGADITTELEAAPAPEGS